MHAGLFASSSMPVEPSWIDYNGHMNLAFYHVLFDRACDEFVPMIGCGPTYRAATNHTIFAAEAHVRYRRELNHGDEAWVRLRLLNHDQKRVHLGLELFHSEGWLSATSELLWLHVDQSGPRVSPFPADILEKIEGFQTIHREFGVPEWIGASVGSGVFC